MQMADEVPESSGAGCRQGSGRFWCRWLMRFQGSGADFGGVRCRRFRKVPGQIADEVPERSGADSRQGSGGFRSGADTGFRCRWVMRFRRVPVQIADKVPDCRQGSGGFRCRWLMKLRRVLVQTRF